MPRDDVVYEEVGKVRITDSVVDRIQEMILSSELRPGDALPSERELAARFNVSRNVLREALGVLGQKGLVIVRSGRGTFIAEPSPDQMKDSLELLLRLRHVSLVELCETRLLIEPELAALAAKNASTSDTSDLTKWMNDLRDAEHEASAHVRADLGFHSEIARMARHSVLQTIVEVVREPVMLSMMFGTRVPRAISDSDAHHEDVWRSIVNGDEAAARASMHAHLSYVADYVRANEPDFVSRHGNAR